MPLEPLELPYGSNTLCYTGRGSFSGSDLGEVEEEQTVLSILCCLPGLPCKSPRNAAFEWSLTFMLGFGLLS